MAFGKWSVGSVVVSLALTSLGCTSAEDASTRTPAGARQGGFDIAVTSSLSSVIVSRGGGATATLTVRRAGFTGALVLTVEGLSQGVTGEVSPVPLPPSSAETQTVSLAVRARADAAEGTQRARIRAQGRDLGVIDVVVRALPLPTVRVDTTISPLNPTATDDADRTAPPRPVSRLVDTRSATDFIEGELVVTDDDATAVAALAASFGGRVVTRFSPRAMGVATPDVHLVRFDPATVDVSDVVQDLAATSPRARGDLKVSSRAGLGTLAAAARAGRSGLVVSMQLLAEPQIYQTRVIHEAPAGSPPLTGTGTYSDNPFDWIPYRRDGIQRMGVAESWRALELAGRLGNRVTVGVLDQGFGSMYMPPGTRVLGGGADVRTEGTCQTGDSTHPCPAWHGTGTVQVIGATHNDRSGIAGVGAPVASVVAYHGNRSVYDLSLGAVALFNAGARVINISKNIWFAATITGQAVGINSVTSALHNQGAVIYASAGNDGRDVDSEDCFTFFCWEDTWVVPCENDGVECVGGVARGNTYRDAASAYGASEVDIFAPFYLPIGANPDVTADAAYEVGGTSVSSPFMAGVAALVWAANPSLTADQVIGTINGTARATGYAESPRLVQPFAAVRSALGPQAPVVRITSPSDGTTMPYGGTHFVTLSADVFDVEDASDQLTVRWTSDVDGALGTGPSVVVSFATPGARTITVTATDTSGRSTSATVHVTTVNSGPTAIISAPTTATRFFNSVPAVFHGRATDPEEGALPCSALTWTIDRVPSWSATGCDVAGVFNVLGAARVTLRATDAQGATSSSSVDVLFDAPASTGTPTATIVSPPDGQLLSARGSTHLSGIGSGSLGSVMLVWTVTEGDVETFVGLGPEVDWTPATTSTSRCGTHNAVLTLYAYDGTGIHVTTTITVTLDFGPC